MTAHQMRAEQNNDSISDILQLRLLATADASDSIA
jgi:hypothetical protein